MRSNLTKIVIVASAALLSACSPKNAVSLLPDMDAIFSNRPQIADSAFVLIKLSHEPLVTTIKTVEGKQTVDKAEAEAITLEQDKLIADLQKISSEIKVVFRYRMVLNGIAISAPASALDKIKSLANVLTIEGSGNFSRPVVKEDQPKKPSWENIRERNSVKFIGAEEAHQRGIRGQGVKVGIIDTGIDYTHAMFGGAGTVAAYKAVDPSQPNAGFPSKKVVGGIDLVGTGYDSASGDYHDRIPHPDANPIDEAGHGSHVAGTVAGVGDGVNSYDGVAPEAQLYAIKVFGKDGSTGDAVVIAALEYSVDPNADADLSDRLDVVNLSLGSGYGEGHILYTQAVRNTVNGGVSVVASAGNSGDTSYVVGAPSVAEDALSVAASVDNMDHNWKFRGVKFSTVADPEIYTEAIEAPIALSIEEAGDVTGELIHVGLADKDFSDEMKAQIKGKVAFADRGIVPFAEKIRRSVEAGAIGVVVVNNQPGPAFQMGGEGEFKVPAIMIEQALGEALKAAQAQGPVTIQFKTDKKIEKPELIDTMAAFSSKGPRSLDALVKPEIAAPGNAIVSAKMGGGAQGESMSGTSMAAPHMSGVMALLKQAHPTLTASELKALAVGTAKSMVDDKKVPYSISRQGAGRVQVLAALDAKLIADPVAVSLGEMTLETQKVLKRDFTVKNVTTTDISAAITFEGNSGISMSGPANILVAAGETKSVSLKFTVNASAVKESSGELDGLIKLSDLGGEVLRLPVLAVVNRVAQVKVDSLKVSSTSAKDSVGAVTTATLSNRGVNSGDAYLFNLLATDARKKDPTHDQFRSKACDLSEVSYRVIKREGVEILQVAAKLYEPMTTWDNCEVSVLIDADGDGVADQELVGAKQDHLKGLPGKAYASILLDAPKTRELRRQFELDVAAGKKVEENYLEAVVELNPFTAIDHSTIAIVEAPVSALKRTASGELSVQVAASYQELSAIEYDDYLNNKWYALSVAKDGQGFVDMPEKTSLAAGASETIELTKGAGSEKLVALFPQNRTVVGGLDKDEQSQVAKPTFGASITKK